MASASETPARFACEDRALVDYSAPLKKLPRDRLPSGQLPFGPSDLGIRSGPSVLVAGEPISYAVNLDRATLEDGRLRRPAQLGLTIDVEVTRIDQRGRAAGEARKRRWSIERVRVPERRIGLRTGPGVYRVALRIG